MKFHGFETLYEYNKELHGKEFVAGDFYLRTLQNFHAWYHSADSAKGKASALSSILMCELDRSWYAEMRPYYKVWPSLLGSLCKLKLNIPGNQVSVKRRTICIRFACGNEPLAGGYCINSLLLSRNTSWFGHDAKNSTDTLDSMESIVIRPVLQGTRLVDGCASIIPLNDETIEHYLSRSIFFTRSNSQRDAGVEEAFSLAVKISLSVLLLADDPSIIEPDVLSKDELAYEHTKDQKYVDKARRRGKVGWHIGKTFEAIPHYRRPHPALYHVGKGRKEQRIVFRQGCVVHREKMTKVPTGYITPEGVEVESE